MQAYAGDNGGKIPKWYDGSRTWDIAIWKYLKNKKILTCPSNRSNANGTPWTADYVRSYAMPKNVSGQVVEQALKPSATVLIFEKGSQPLGTVGDAPGEWFQQTWGYDIESSHKFWHNGGKTFAFCDGHAAYYKYPKGPFSYNFVTNHRAWSGSYVNNPGYGTPGYCGYADTKVGGTSGSVAGANLPR
jgi:prepilin-type processing-associated H-X9-DG protein